MRMYSLLAGVLLGSISTLSAFDLRVTDNQFNKAVTMLDELVAIRSVSHPNSPDYNMQHLKDAASYIESKLLDLGFEVSSTSIEGSAPFVMGKLGNDAYKPTVLLYAHYDVQPVDRTKWLSDPFIMEERDGRLYGRGASDDKAGICSILTAVEAYLQAGEDLPVNVKVLFEGEEEWGSEHMAALLEQNGERLQADTLVVLDGGNRAVDTGTLTSSTRGIVNIDLTVKALAQPVHSGIGCLVPDPAQALAALIHSIQDPRTIPGFMEGAEKLNKKERQMLAKSSLSTETYARELGVLQHASLRGDENVSIYERIVEEPSVTIVNMNSGLPHGGNSVQDSASCTISIRVLPGQDPDIVATTVIRY